MPHTLADVIRITERLWPSEGSEAWDATGLIVGDPSTVIERIHLAVDAVIETADEAVASGADLLLVHHPLLLRGVTAISEDHYKGSVVARLIRGNCALLAAHTNADVVETGTSAILAERLGVLSAKPIVEGPGADVGLGRVGTLAEPMTLGRFARLVAEVLPATATGVRVAGSYDEAVRTVAVCGGAGDSLLSHPSVRSADVYVTADLRHHPASEAREATLLGSGPALIDVSHWASEWLWLEVAADELRRELPGIAVTVSEARTDPWDFAIVQ